MKVYKHGTRVKTLIGDIEGLITAISIRVGSISYEISYFSSGIYYNIWLNDFEFEVCSKKSDIGFNKTTDIVVSNQVEINIK